MNSTTMNINIKADNQGEVVQPHQQDTKRIRIKYKIEFPPGAMGLELEPVIKSSEREVGCRVKDFYFSIDHEGVDQAYLESRVSIGDIVTSINGEDIRSLPFITIVGKLKMLKDCTRVVTFKNITASWVSKGSSIGAIDEPSLPLSPAPVFQKKVLGAQDASIRTASLENVENESDAAYSLQARISSNKNVVKAGSAPVWLSPRSARKGLALLQNAGDVSNTVTIDKRTSINVSSHETYRQGPVSRSSSSGVVAKSDRKELLGSRLKPQLSDLSQPSFSPPMATFIERKEKKSPILNDNEPGTVNTTLTISPIRPVLNHNNIDNRHLKCTEDENSINENGGSIRRMVGSLSSALEKQTTEVFSDLIPVYSEREMKEILDQKNNLLSELSQCLLLLRTSEERSKQIEEQLIRSEEFQRRFHDLQSRHDILQTSYETQQVKIQKYEAEMMLHQKEKQENEELIDSLTTQLLECQRFNQESLRQVDSLTAKFASFESEREREQKLHQEKIAIMCDEKLELRRELSEAYEKAEEKLSTLEQEKSTLSNQITALELENLRYKENNQQLLSQKKSMVIENEQERHSQQQKIVSFCRELETTVTKLIDLQRDYDQLSQQHQEVKVKQLVYEQERSNFNRLLEEKDKEIHLAIQQKKTLEFSLHGKEILFKDLQQQNSLIQDQQYFSDLTIQAHIKEINEIKIERDRLLNSWKQKDFAYSKIQQAWAQVRLCNAQQKQQLQIAKEKHLKEIQSIKDELEISLLREVLPRYQNRITSLTHFLQERNQTINLMESASRELQQQWKEQNLHQQTLLQERDKKIAELQNSLTTTQQELSNCLTIIEEIRHNLTLKEESLLSLQKEKERLDLSLADSKRSLLVENAKAIQQLHTENNQLQTTLREKSIEIASLLTLIQSCKDSCEKERQEKVLIGQQYDELCQQAEAQGKLLREYQSKLSMSVDQEKKLTGRLSLLLGQLQEKELSIQRLEMEAKHQLESVQSLQLLTAQLEKDRLSLQEELCQLNFSIQQKDTELQMEQLRSKSNYQSLQTKFDQLAREHNNTQEKCRKERMLLQELKEQILPLPLCSLKSMMLEIKTEVIQLQQLHGHIIKAHKDKSDNVEKKLSNLAFLSSVTHADAAVEMLQRSEREKQETIAQLTKDKEDYAKKLATVEKSLSAAEQKSLHLENTLQDKESQNLRLSQLAQSTGDQINVLTFQLQQQSQGFDLSKESQKKDYERRISSMELQYQQKLQQLKDQIQVANARQITLEENLSVLQKELLSRENEIKELSRRSENRQLSQSKLYLQEELRKLNIQLHLVQDERREISVQIKSMTGKTQEDLLILCRQFDQRVKLLSNEWEAALVEKQQHFTKELSHRDEMIQELQLVSKENVQLHQETVQEMEMIQEQLRQKASTMEAEHQCRIKLLVSLLLRLHGDCQAIKLLHHHLKDEVTAVSAAFVDAAKPEHTKLAIQEGLSSWRKKMSVDHLKMVDEIVREKERAWVEKCRSMQFSHQHTLQQKEEIWKVKCEQEIIQQRQLLEKQYQAAMQETKSNILLLTENCSKLCQKNELILEEKAFLVRQYETQKHAFQQLQQEKEDLFAMHIAALNEREDLSIRCEKAADDVQRCEERIKQCEKEKQDKVTLVRNLRETIRSMETTLALAASRELETKEIIATLNSKLLQREKDAYSLERSYQSLSEQYAALNKELSEKNDELHIFHQSLQHLIYNSSSNLPTHDQTKFLSPNTANHADEDKHDPLSIEVKSCDKENSPVFAELKLSSVLLSGEIEVFETKEGNYIEKLLFASLELHQSLAYLSNWASSRQDELHRERDVARRNLMEGLEEVSILHRKLHEAIRNPPWLTPDEKMGTELAPMQFFSARSDVSDFSKHRSEATIRRLRNDIVFYQFMMKTFLCLYRRHKARLPTDLSFKSASLSSGFIANQAQPKGPLVPPEDSSSLPSSLISTILNVPSHGHRDSTPKVQRSLSNEGLCPVEKRLVEINDQRSSLLSQPISSSKSSKATVDERTYVENTEVAAASLESTDELIRRIDRFLTSVKTLENETNDCPVLPSQLHEKQGLSDLGEVYKVSAMKSARVAELESQDKVLLAGVHHHSQFQTRETRSRSIGESNSQILAADSDLDESLTTDFWNISTDEEPSMMLDLDQ